MEHLVGAVTTVPSTITFEDEPVMNSEATEEEALSGHEGTPAAAAKQCRGLGGRSPSRSFQAPNVAELSHGRLYKLCHPGAFPGIRRPGLEGDTITKKSVTKDLTKVAIFPIHFDAILRP